MPRKPQIGDTWLLDTFYHATRKIGFEYGSDNWDAEVRNYATPSTILVLAISKKNGEYDIVTKYLRVRALDLTTGITIFINVFYLSIDRCLNKQDNSNL